MFHLPWSSVEKETSQTHICSVSPEVVHYLARHARQVRVSLVSLCLALLTVLGGMVVMHERWNNSFLIKNAQVNALIDEVGDLQSQRDAIMAQMQSNQKSLSTLNTDLGTVLSAAQSLEKAGLRLKELTDFNTALLQAKAKLEHTVLDQKTMVTQLFDKTVRLSSDLDQTTLNDTTFDVLFVGTHGSLTDTLLLATVNEEKKTVTLVSIPRDLFVHGRKINEYYYKFGMAKLQDIVEEVSGRTVDKYVVVDLQGFVSIVDLLGGVDITVEKALTDYSYPNNSEGYETFSIGAGAQHLDGATALKYARSRHSTSDFDRALRQQQIIDAVRSKLEAFDVIGHVDDAVALFQAAASAVTTDMDVFDAMNYWKRFSDFALEQGNVLTTSNYLYSTHSTSGQYILLPKTTAIAGQAGDWGAVQGYINGLVEE